MRRMCSSPFADRPALPQPPSIVAARTPAMRTVTYFLIVLFFPPLKVSLSFDTFIFTPFFAVCQPVFRRFSGFSSSFSSFSGRSVQLIFSILRNFSKSTSSERKGNRSGRVRNRHFSHIYAFFPRIICNFPRNHV